MLTTAPFADKDKASGLSRGDSDYWQFKISPNAKGKLPTHLVYELGSPSTVVIAIFRGDTLYFPPQYTQTFRPNVSEKIVLENLKTDEKIKVQIRHLAGAATCYALKFETF